MSSLWYAGPGTHAVQFYENERFLHRAASAFVDEALQGINRPVMIARRRTLDAVTDRLASRQDGVTVDPGRIMFVDVESALHEFMDGDVPDPVRFAQSFSTIVDKARQDGSESTLWFYGEMVDVLCRQDNHAAALRVEKLWNVMSAGVRASVMCGYAIESFDDDMHASRFRSICRQHTHVLPSEGYVDAPDDRAKSEHVALLQQRARALDAALARKPRGSAAGALTTATVYVVDDDPSVRRSLARLLASVQMRVETFASAEAFLDGADRAAGGCLIADVQLVGMGGFDLQRRMAEGEWAIPVIVMSGSHDPRIESEALRLGAAAFLRKPFEAQSLLDAIARAIR